MQTDAIDKCPDMREDGLDWRPNAQFRALSRGQDLGFHVAVLNIPGGWGFFVKGIDYFRHVLGSVMQGVSFGSWVISEM